MNIINNKGNIEEEFIPKYYEYITSVMQRDIPQIPVNDRLVRARYMIEYIRLAIQKGYFDDNNIYEMLERLVNTSGTILELNDPYLYGDCVSSVGGNPGHLSFNFNMTGNVRNVVFHEMTHAVANIEYALGKYDLGYYKEKKNIKVINRSDQHEENSNGQIKVINRSDNYERIIDDGFTTFIDEVIAEATACDLSGSYRPSNKVCGNEKYGYYESTWNTAYNTRYQQLGYEFFQTVYGTDYSDKELFKKITKIAMGSGEKIIKDILDAYQRSGNPNWKDDLNKITKFLSGITGRFKLDKKLEEAKEIKELMNKYKRNINIPKLEDNSLPRIDTPTDKPKISINPRFLNDTELNSVFGYQDVNDGVKTPGRR